MLKNREETYTSETTQKLEEKGEKEVKILTRKLTIKRKGYWRKGYTRKDGTKVKRTWVPASSYKIRDIGAPGRGKKVIPKMRPGRMIKDAITCGVMSKRQFEKGKRIGDLSNAKIKKLANYLRKKYGQRRAFGMFHAQVVFRKRQPDGFKRKMKIGREVARGKPGEWDKPRRRK